MPTKNKTYMPIKNKTYMPTKNETYMPTKKYFRAKAKDVQWVKL